MFPVKIWAQAFGCAHEKKVKTVLEAAVAGRFGDVYLCLVRL